MEEVILVDEEDNEIGVCEKIKAHKKALLHRAISVIIFNDAGKILIQRRAFSKYHCPGLWSNACCTHPRVGEANIDSAKRRLKEEIGIECDLKEIFNFIYTKKFGNGLTENEFDHTFWGRYNGEVNINQAEASEYKWIEISNLLEEMTKRSEEYSYWFKIILNIYLENLNSPLKPL